MRYLMASILFLFLTSTLYASSVKELSLVCEKLDVLEDIERIKQHARDGLIPRNCLLLTSDAKIKVLENVKQSPAVKILIVDLNIVGYILREDILYDEADKKKFDFF